MEGRASGTPGGDRAAQQIARWLGEAGLEPGGDRGTFFQSFVLSTGTSIAPASGLGLVAPDARRLEVDRDWRPHGGSAQAEVTGRIAFVGYGVEGPEAGWNDYHGADVAGTIAIALDGVPPGLGNRMVTRLEKVVTARRHGVAALLIVSDRLPALAATGAHVRLPSGSITPEAADVLLGGSGPGVAALGRAITTRNAPDSFTLPAEARLRVALRREDQPAANLIGIVRGRDRARAHEAVVVGAHYDHLGVVNGDVHPGADDNASGTAAVVALARAFSAAPAARTLVFALFGAEEIGLIGSRHYVQQPPVPLERTVAMVNLDMVGRLRGQPLHVGGVDSGDGLTALVNDTARATGVPVRVGGAPWAPSDHVRFYRAGTPVVFFSTGRHDDYHRPTDLADRIDADGLARVTALASRVVQALAAGDRPSYVALAEPRPEPRGAPGDRPAGQVLFGIVGDTRAGDGLRLTSVLPGGGAERAGLREGDVIIRFAGQSVDRFETLRTMVGGRRPGDVVEVVYLRDGEDRTAQATLGTRP